MGNPLPQRSLLSRHTRSLLGSILRPDCARSNDRNRKRGQTFIRSIEFLFSIFTRASLDLRSSISISKWTLRPAGNRSIRLNGPIRLFNLDFVWLIEFSFFQSKFYSSNEKLKMIRKYQFLFLCPFYFLVKFYYYRNIGKQILCHTIGSIAYPFDTKTDMKNPFTFSPLHFQYRQQFSSIFPASESFLNREGKGNG